MTPLQSVLVVVLILLLLGALPFWPYATGWGYAPGSVAFIALVVVLVLILSGRL